MSVPSQTCSLQAEEDMDNLLVDELMERVMLGDQAAIAENKRRLQLLQTLRYSVDVHCWMEERRMFKHMFGTCRAQSCKHSH